MISGSYWPGDISLFRGEGGGRFHKGEILKAIDGTNVNAGPPWKSTRKPEMDSLAAAPRLQDVDGDGDLDLLVGNIAGHVILIENEGDAAHPRFGGRKSRVQAGGRDLDARHNDAGPTTADWDGDGLWDLIVGSGDGSVTFFKNTGTAKAMHFAAGVQLIARNENMSIAHEATPTRSYARAKPHVCDWNGDGLPDLLVGDFASIEMPEPKLTAEQTQKRDTLRKERDELNDKMQKYYQAMEEKELEGDAKAEYDKLSRRYSELWQELTPLEKEHKTGGWVWVYLRKPAPKATGEVGLRGQR